MNADPTLAPSPPAEERPSHTITAADLLAARVDGLIDEIEAIIPDLETPHPSRSGNARAARTVSRAFILAMIADIEHEPDWQSLGLFDAEEAQAVLQFNDAFRPVARRLVTLARRINFTMASRNAKIAIGAMNTYMMAKRFARKPANAAMGAHLDKLRRLLGRKNGRSAKAVTVDSAMPALG
jgi:hypothetical protein